ncbi:DEAD/DEAH box helicase [Rhizobium laguerreae]|uniref:DEAD/DEAH box helicase n=1 Tax=Rhizobium laguerreae TaxID=1076926 RepID=UPI001C91BF69|nr:DEAD/DEAH box helicase [Rhizobium laguerreae]MBY3294460.1 DEAD/DEAH box helicase [Rhizobium laguerreae]MBY3495636.1 DEAD/DEAH box helicase [Rhizobium laguerreae]MBY3543538.1 DEAD/DEAH box helicase [Rhizobium laguerreae]
MHTEIQHMRDALTTYIEATYHLSHPKLVALRKKLLLAGGVSQIPFIESTPSYLASRLFDTLELPAPVRAFLTSMASKENGEVLFDPPYDHQADALELSASGSGKGRAIVVTTGTGSGKTETFLLPVLARLAEEAAERPGNFSKRAIRALLLYPMNALVNDQLGRLRNLFGVKPVRNWFEDQAGRPAKFGRYTGRTLYPGPRNGGRDQRRLKSLNYFLGVEDNARNGEPEDIKLVNLLKRKGRWPSKPDSTDNAFDGLRNWYGRPIQRWETPSGDPARAVERQNDPELLTRHEIQEACPDLLVTNYSMLEYMLLRPIERDIFTQTRSYYEAHPDETFFLVLDEAHLYRGANGTEVAYLIRRLLDRLNLPPSRVAFIVTSASFSDPSSAREFVAGLTGLDQSAVTVIVGEKRSFHPAGPGSDALAQALADIDLADLQSTDPRVRAEMVIPLARLRPEIAGQRAEVQRRDRGAQSITATVSGIGAGGVRLDETLIVPANGTARTEASFLLLNNVQVDNGAVGFARAYSLGNVQAGAPVQWESDDLPAALHDLLENLPVVGRMKNVTSGARSDQDPVPLSAAAWSIDQLSDVLFQQGDARSDALDSLLELSSIARETPASAPLLPARVHMFYRGLPGLWACSNPQCDEIKPAERGGPTGRLYAEPKLVCGCNSQVFELHSCRSCGMAVAHASIASPAGIEHLWQESGEAYADETQLMEKVQVCLEEPSGVDNAVRVAFLDTRSGRIDGIGDGPQREVWLPGGAGSYQFANCPRCGTPSTPGSANGISDLQTKGEQPFQELVSVQVLEQPPRPEVDTALKGRKALIFSDGRQTASRLAGTLKTFSLRDSLRPLLLKGMQDLAATPYKPSLDDAPLAIAFGAANRDVRLRPSGDVRDMMTEIGDAAKSMFSGDQAEQDDFKSLSNDASNRSPYSIFVSLYAVLHDKHTGLLPLALAKLTPKLTHYDRQRLASSMVLPRVEGFDDDTVRNALLELWLWQATVKRAILFEHTPPGLENANNGAYAWKGNFSKRLIEVLKSQGHGQWLKNSFKQNCRPVLVEIFGRANADGHHILASKIRLEVAPHDHWMRCERCTNVAPANILIGNRCAMCEGPTRAIDPATDSVFRSRKAFFRRLWERMNDPSDGYVPHMLVAEEHSAALGDAGQINAMSRNEAYELRFQDIPIRQDGQMGTPIDILSSTTTMEVGIDIGGLTAVALRNVPPGRANYQQRAGRAGRRGAGLATVITYCGADSHDQSFFREPSPIVAGPAPDPILNLDNEVIARRQASAYVIGLFQQERISLADAGSDVFSSLGSVDQFLDGDVDAFSIAGLTQWIGENEAALTAALDRLFVASCPSLDANELLTSLPGTLLSHLAAPNIGDDPTETAAGQAPTAAIAKPDEDPEDVVLEDEMEVVAKKENGKLLDALFDEALLPKYAFPTDVASFSVFEDGTDPWNPKRRYSPQLGLNAALSQYAPGNEVWVDGQRYLSLGLYAENDGDLKKAYDERRLYYCCHRCGFAELRDWDQGFLDETRDCPACGTRAGLGPARRWVRPPGFSHPPHIPPNPPSFDSGPPLRPTRATLDALSFSDDLRFGTETWPLGTGWEGFADNRTLVVTNKGTEGTDRFGFNYCSSCGRIEPSEFDPAVRRLVAGQTHPRPRPKRPKEAEECNGRYSRIVLGNDFKTDVAVFRLAFPIEWNLEPDRNATTIAARSAAEALRRAACMLEDLEPNDIDGDFRFAPGNSTAQFIDLYLYDQAAGGAGFVKAATRSPHRLVDKALSLLDNCTCDDSCYQCLRSYRNRFDHKLFDRRIGADLLRATFKGVRLDLDARQAASALARLEADIKASGGHVTPAQGGLLDDSGRLICLSHPFQPDAPVDALAKSFDGDVVPIDLLLVVRALPIATNQTMTDGGQPNRQDGADTTGGVPELTTREASLGVIQPGANAGRYPVAVAQENDFVFRLNANTLSGSKGDGTRAVPKGTLCLFRPVDGPPVDNEVYLIHHQDGDAFGATGDSWTVGIIQDKGAEGTRVRYRADSRHMECASELVPPTRTIVALAKFIKAVS